MLRSWALDCISEMLFGFTCGVPTLVRAEVVRASRAVTGDSGNIQPPKIALVKLTEGNYKIPTTIASPRVTTLSKRESLYVHHMLLYLSKIAVYLTFRQG